MLLVRSVRENSGMFVGRTLRLVALDIQVKPMVDPRKIKGAQRIALHSSDRSPLSLIVTDKAWFILSFHAETCNVKLWTDVSQV